MPDIKAVRSTGRILFISMIMVAAGRAGIAQKQTPSSGTRSYYFSPGGDDRNKGDRIHPFKTPGRLNTLFLQPGDTVFFQAGQTFEGSMDIITGSGGTKEHPAVITSYGKGKAVINSGDRYAIGLYQAKYISITNLQLTGSGRKSGNKENGLAINNCHHIMVDGIDITGFQKAGLMIYSSTDVLIERVYAHENGAAGIAVEGSGGKRESNNLRIRYCRADDNPGDPTNLTNHSGNGIVAGHCSNLLIDHCSATNNGWDMPRIGNGPVGIWCYEADSVTIQYCLAYRNKTSAGGADGGGFDLDGGVTNSVIQYCLSYGNQGSGYCIFQYWGASPWYHNIIRWNISEDDGGVSDSRAGVYVWNSSEDAGQFYDCVVHNNTIYNTKEAAISYSEKSARKQFVFYNNIFVGRDSLIRGDRGADVFGGNDWWLLRGGAGDTAAGYAGAGRGVGISTGGMKALYLAPAFSNPGHTRVTAINDLPAFDKYRIPLHSPLREQGVDLHGSFGIDAGAKDFNGQKAPLRGIGASF